MQQIEAAFVVRSPPRKSASSPSTHELHTVSELCDTDLFGYLFDQEGRSGGGPLPEEDTAFCFRQVLEALAACHAERVAHLDIKPENVLVKLARSPEEDLSLQLADFGAAHCLGGLDEPQTPSPTALRPIERSVGSSSYLAPETVRSDAFCANSDAWAAGVLLFVMLRGESPWGELSPEQVSSRLQRGEVPPQLRACTGVEETDGISPEALDLLQGLLEPNYRFRTTVEEALVHPFTQKGVW